MPIKTVFIQIWGNPHSSPDSESESDFDIEEEREENQNDLDDYLHDGWNILSSGVFENDREGYFAFVLRRAY